MKKEMTITYEVDGALYINVTNRCTNNCEFCIRKNGDGAYGSDSLWLEREPTEEEIIRAYRNLKAHKNKVDYVLTHKYRIENPKANPLTQNGFLNFVDNCVEYKHWYSGHWHKTKYLDEKHTVVYRTLTPLAE